MTRNSNPWLQELQSIGRSFMRAMIFGVAFLYTMEMWWVGAWLPYQRLMIFFGVALLVDLYLLPLTESTKQEHPLGWVLRTTIRNKGLAILVSAVILFILGEVSPFSPPYERDLSIILLLSIPIGIGFNIARILQIYQTPGRTGKGGQKGQQGAAGSSNNQSEKDEEDEEAQQSKAKEDAANDEQQGDQTDEKNPWWQIIRTLGLVVGGTLFIALPLAPTGEITMLAARLEFWRQVAIMVLAILITYSFVYASGADRQPPGGNNSRGKEIWPWADTLMSYAVALIVSLGMLYLFGQISAATPLEAILANVIVLALPASIGGAAGKLALG